MTNWKHLFEWLTELASSRQLGLVELIEELQATREGYGDDTEQPEDADHQRLETERSAVQLATIHKCKGLEAEVVFMCGGFTGPFSKNSHNLKVFSSHEEPGRVIAFEKEADGVDQLQQEYDVVDRQERQRQLYVALTRAVSKMYLPYWHVADGERKEKRIEPLMRALDHLHEGDGSDQVTFRPFDPTSAPAHEDNETSVEIAADSLQEVWAALEASRTEPERAHTRIITSYSGLSDHGGVPKTHVEDPRADRFGEEHVLPGGMRSGDAMHQAFEFLDYGSVAGYSDARQWLVESDQAAVIDEALEAHGFEPQVHRAYLAQVVIDTLNTNISPAMGPNLGRLSELSSSSTSREVSFKLPIPTDGQHAGYFTGEIDLVFVDAAGDGRVYFADWKSDSRLAGGDDYSPATLREHVAHEYRIQAGIYSLALQQLLGARDRDTYAQKVGGFFYFFPRGMTGDGRGHGHVYEPPNFEALRAFEQRLAELDEPDKLAEIASSLSLAHQEN
mgnify:FL=1